LDIDVGRGGDDFGKRGGSGGGNGKGGIDLEVGGTIPGGELGFIGDFLFLFEKKIKRMSVKRESLLHRINPRRLFFCKEDRSSGGKIFFYLV